MRSILLFFTLALAGISAAEPAFTNGQAARLLVGQPTFTAQEEGGTASRLGAVSGIAWSNDQLYVVDANRIGATPQNNRVLIYRNVPSSFPKLTQEFAVNDQRCQICVGAADIVLGQPDFNTFVEPDLTKASADTSASNLINPVAATSDGIRLYVADLGHNRVLIWNSIPTRNQTAADVVLGQAAMTDAAANNSPKLCPTNGTDADGNATYPKSCEKTMDFPRYALSDGQRLFIADGGNDRVLIYNHIPTSNGEAADAIIGQLGGGINQASDSTDSMRTPMSLYFCTAGRTLAMKASFAGVGGSVSSALSRM